MTTSRRVRGLIVDWKIWDTNEWDNGQDIYININRFHQEKRRNRYRWSWELNPYSRHFFLTLFIVKHRTDSLRKTVTIRMQINSVRAQEEISWTNDSLACTDSLLKTTLNILIICHPLSVRISSWFRMSSRTVVLRLKCPWSEWSRWDDLIVLILEKMQCEATWQRNSVQLLLSEDIFHIIVDRKMTVKTQKRNPDVKLSLVCVRDPRRASGGTCGDSNHRKSDAYTTTLSRN